MSHPSRICFVNSGHTNRELSDNWYEGQCRLAVRNECSSAFIYLWNGMYMTRKTKQLRGLSPQANYTDRATATCGRSQCKLLRIKGVTWSAWRILEFLDRSRYFFFQVAPRLYSRGWVDPVPDPLLLRESGSAGNRTWTSGSVARNADH
jgi:hypothetical protein